MIAILLITVTIAGIARAQTATTSTESEEELGLLEGFGFALEDGLAGLGEQRGSERDRDGDREKQHSLLLESFRSRTQGVTFALLAFNDFLVNGRVPMLV
jgi:hypothetical protein